MSAADVPPPDRGEASRPGVDPQSIEGLFLAALGRASPAERDAFLNETCGDDAVRRRRVEALLRAYDDAGSFLEQPAVPHAFEAGPERFDFLDSTDKPGCIGTLGHNEVIDVIGRGGMGIVFRALDSRLNRIVAIKVLAPHLAANPNARRRFLREAQAAAAVSHPHVVTIHAVDEAKLPYLVMECIVGQSLQQKLDKTGPLRLTETLRIGQQIAEGLSAAHKQGLIHRDIKPANILLENGVERVKITDFGLARAADDVAITRTGELSGTPQYMSPEQARGDKVDHRSDLFSLGCVLYAMCTGRSPFRADSLAGAIKRVCEDTPRPIEQVNLETPGWLIDIVNQLLDKDAERRIQSAAEVAVRLEKSLARVQGAAASVGGAATAPVLTMPRAPEAVPRPLAWSEMHLGQRLITAGLVVGALVFVGLLLGLLDIVELPPFRHDEQSALFLVVMGLGLAGGLLAAGLSLKPRQVGTQSPALLDEAEAQRQLWGRRLVVAGCAGMVLPIVAMLLLAMYLSGSPRNVRFPFDPDEVGAAVFFTSIAGCLVLAIGLGLQRKLLGADVWADIFQTMLMVVFWPITLPLWLARRSSDAPRPHAVASQMPSRPWNPWTILGWTVLASFLLCGFGMTLGLAWPYLSRQNTAHVQFGVLEIEHDPDDIIAKVQFDGANAYFDKTTNRASIPQGVHEVRVFLQNGRIESFTVDVSPLTIERISVASTRMLGALLIDFADPGLQVDFRLMDANETTTAQLLPDGGGPPINEIFETGVFRLRPGRYQMAILDFWAGWRPIADLNATTRQLDAIEVRSGEITTVTVKRDFSALAQMMPESLGLSIFRWHERDYSLSPTQSRVVQKLLTAHAENRWQVSEADLLAASQSPTDATVSYIFNEGKHPAWGSLIVPADCGEGTCYQLAPLRRQPEPPGLERSEPPSLPSPVPVTPGRSGGFPGWPAPTTGDFPADAEIPRNQPARP